MKTVLLELLIPEQVVVNASWDSQLHRSAASVQTVLSEMEQAAAVSNILYCS